MGRHFTVNVAGTSEGVVTVALAFGKEPARNDDIIREALAEMDALGLKGGRGVKFNGPASLPVAMALGHKVAHLYGFVACYDPKLERYVVAISHDPDYRPGDLIP